MQEPVNEIDARRMSFLEQGDDDLRSSSEGLLHHQFIELVALGNGQIVEARNRLFLNSRDWGEKLFQLYRACAGRDKESRYNK